MRPFLNSVLQLKVLPCLNFGIAPSHLRCWHTIHKYGAAYFRLLWLWESLGAVQWAAAWSLIFAPIDCSLCFQLSIKNNLESPPLPLKILQARMVQVTGNHTSLLFVFPFLALQEATHRPRTRATRTSWRSWTWGSSWGRPPWHPPLLWPSRRCRAVHIYHLISIFHSNSIIIGKKRVRKAIWSSSIVGQWKLDYDHQDNRQEHWAQI